MKDIKKIVTFSFDDGVEDDVRLVEILNKYGLKCTFNLNSGLLTNCNSWNYENKKTVAHLNYYDCRNLYKGHEIACHGYTHPNFTELDYDTTYNEIALDIKLLEMLFDCKIRGMAYPFGVYDDKTLEIMKKLNIEYSRGVESTRKFDFPKNPLVLDPTCHYKEEGVKEIVEEFVNLTCDEPKLLYIWGHSYEMVTKEDWNNFEELCKYLSDRDDILYCTNIEALDWIKQNG